MSNSFGRERKTAGKAGKNKRRAGNDFDAKDGFKRAAYKSRQQRKQSSDKQTSAEGELLRLNRYIALSGACSRREADEYIRAGAVTVNGKVVTELGTKVRADDKVQFGGQTIRPEKPVYLLLNKPKDYITTTDDPQQRKTVMHLIRHACRERIYPVGRLDRNTTGLLLFTNDGELAKKLSHPGHRVKKLYHVVADRPVSAADLDALVRGIMLEDGPIQADAVAYVSGAADRRQIGIELHSGKNRIVRRMMEHLGYKVIKLDRVMYAGLTKKDLPRGKYRFLNAKEVTLLKMIK